MAEPALKKLKSSLSSSQDVNKNVFQSILDQSGILYDEGFKVEDIVASKKSITQALQFDKPLTQQFVNDFEQELSDPNTLKTYLVPVIVSTSDNLFQESVIKLLLNIDCLQPFLINILLEKLPQFNEDDSVFDKFNQSISRNIISHLKWLDHIVDSSKLVQKLVEILPICDSKLQKEIITSIPEILEDTSHEDIVLHLLNLMNEDSQFTLPVIDTLTNLNLSSTVQDQVRGSIMKTLTSAALEQLPLIIKFILQSVTSNNLPKIVHELRECVVIETFSLSTDSQSVLSLDPSISNNNNNQPRDVASLTLLLDALKSAFRFNKEIATTFIKEIQSIEVAEEHKLLDFFILLILYSLNTHKKTAESILRKKIQNNLIGENLIKSALSNHSVSLKEYVSCIITLAEAFLRSNDSSLIHSASDLYSLTFKLSKDNVYKQDIIGSLVTHVGSGTPNEIDAALSVLESLVEEDALSLAPYSVFIKGIIDYIFNLEDKQVRKVFHIFSCLSSVKISDRRSSSAVNDELFIVLRKQISSGFIQFKKVGIIGAVAMIMTFGDAEYVNSSEEDPMSALIELVETIEFMTKKYPICHAFFCDELSTIMNFKRLNTRLINYLKDLIEAEWQNSFLESVSELDENSWMKIDDNQNTYEIKIGSIVNNSSTLTKESACLLCSQFKLLQLCERQITDNELSGLGGVLGTSINLFDPSLIKKIQTDKKMKETEKESICLCMFYALNWFRELINAFSSQSKDQDAFYKIVKRIEHTIQLEGQLDRCLACLNHITLPAYNNSGSHTIALKESSNKKKGKSKASEAEASKKDEEEDDDNSTKTTSNSSSDGSYVAMLRPFFRDFDLSACSLLAYQMSSDSEDDLTNIYSFSLPVIRFLVEETQNKVKYIVGSNKKKLTFLPNVQKHQANVAGTVSTLSLYKPLQALKELTPVFPALFIHFGRVFQSMIEETDEMTDSDVANFKHHKPILISILEIFEKTVTFLQEESTLESEHLLREILFKTVYQKQPKKPKLSELYKEVFVSFDTFMAKSLEDSKLAISLTNLLKCFAKKLVHPDLANKLSKYAQKQLIKDWEVKLKSEQVSSLLETHITFATSSLEVIEFLALNILPNSIKKDSSTEEEEIESEYCTLTKATWVVYFKVLLIQLTNEFGLLHQSSIVKDEESTFEDYLIKVEQCVKILFALIEITKIKHDNNQILAVALKQGKTFTEVFMKILPTLSHNYAEHKEAISRVINTLQKCTRQIQSLCAHSKTNESKLASVVPGVRKVLELLLFKMKALYKENNQGKRFFLGNLKPKYITGEAIKNKREEEEEEEAVQDDIEEDNEDPPQDEPEQEEEEEQQDKNEEDESDEIVEDD